MVEPTAHFDHTPVMVDEIVEVFSRVPSGVIVDATIGGAGHAAAILTNYSHLRVYGFDQDSVARAAAVDRLEPFADRVAIYADRFDRCAEILSQSGVDRIAGFLMDLGVSSPQLDVGQRGFSYRHDGPLDMRMDTTRTRTAETVVNEYPLDELIDVLRSYGDERHARRIARAIVEARPLTSTRQLADVIVEAVPAAARRQPGHPAKRSFQAIRIEVNDELSILSASIDALIGLLDTDGVGLVLTYHSGEDRIIKEAMRAAVGGTDLPGMPRSSEFDWLFRGARTPSVHEIDQNPRARSARLRGITRIEPANG